jgi:hypothetical protein
LARECSRLIEYATEVSLRVETTNSGHEQEDVALEIAAKAPNAYATIGGPGDATRDATMDRTSHGEPVRLALAFARLDTQTECSTKRARIVERW